MRPDESCVYIAPVELVASRGYYLKDDIIIRFINGKFYAYRSECPHMPGKGQLQHGEFCPKGLTVKCPRHQFIFSLENGENVNEQLRKYGRLRVLPVIIKGEDIYVGNLTNDTDGHHELPCR